MSFKKGNNLWQKTIEVKKENKAKMEAFLDTIASGAIGKYAGKLEDLSNGAELSKPEIDFMDRTEKWAEYVVPKLARSEQDIKVDGVGFLLGITKPNEK